MSTREMTLSQAGETSMKYVLGIVAIVVAVCAIGCAAKALKATKITVGAPTVDAPRSCDGKFKVREEITITREAPPAPPRKSYKASVNVKAVTRNLDNVTGVTDAEDSQMSDTFTLAHDGTLTDTCKDGKFDIDFSSTSGVNPTPTPRTVIVPALGYTFPDNFPATFGNPKKFTATIKLKNCGAAAVAFALTAKKISNVLDAFTFNPPSPVNIAGGATQTIAIDGEKEDEHASGVFRVEVTPPAPLPMCARAINVE
jgi:hypothetical protein